MPPDASRSRDPQRRPRGARGQGRAGADSRPRRAARRRRGDRRQLPRHLRARGELRRPAAADCRRRGLRDHRRHRGAGRVGRRAGLLCRARRRRRGEGRPGARRDLARARRGRVAPGDDGPLPRALDLPRRAGRHRRRPRGGRRRRAAADPDRQARRRHGDRHDFERGEGRARARSGSRPRDRLRRLCRAGSRPHRRQGRLGRLRRDRRGDLRREPEGAPPARPGRSVRCRERAAASARAGRARTCRVALRDAPDAHALHAHARGAARARERCLRLDPRREARGQDRPELSARAGATGAGGPPGTEDHRQADPPAG